MAQKLIKNENWSCGVALLVSWSILKIGILFLKHFSYEIIFFYLKFTNGIKDYQLHFVNPVTGVKHIFECNSGETEMQTKSPPTYVTY